MGHLGARQRAPKKKKKEMKKKKTTVNIFELKSRRRKQFSLKTWWLPVLPGNKETIKDIG